MTRVLALALAVAAFPAVASAQLAVPYQGTLELNGVPQSGKFHFWFELYGSATGSTVLWDDKFENVDVVSGRFSVALGSQKQLPDALWTTNPEVFLELQVAAPGDAYGRLAGRQRILSVPLAVRAQQAKDFKVSGSLDVKQGAKVTGSATVGKLVLSKSAWAAPVSEAALCNDGGAYQSLMVVGNGTAGEGARKVTIYEDLYVPEGQLTIANGLNLGITLKDCSGNSDVCYCPAGTFPIGYGVSASGAGHFLHKARWVESQGLYGIKPRFITLGPPWGTFDAYTKILTCFRFQQAAPTIPNSSPWTF